MKPDQRRAEGKVPSHLELDHVFEALGHRRRRYLLYSLLMETEWSLWELSEKLAAWEQDLPPETVASEDIETVYLALYHTHVPKLAEAGIVQYSEADEVIEAGPNADQVLAVLDRSGGITDNDQEVHARGESNEGHS